jgi:hypothetical protein
MMCSIVIVALIHPNTTTSQRLHTIMDGNETDSKANPCEGSDSHEGIESSNLM